MQPLLIIIVFLLSMASTVGAQGPHTVGRPPLPTDQCRVGDRWLYIPAGTPQSAVEYLATDCTVGAAIWEIRAGKYRYSDDCEADVLDAVQDDRCLQATESPTIKVLKACTNPTADGDTVCDPGEWSEIGAVGVVTMQQSFDAGPGIALTDPGMEMAYWFGEAGLSASRRWLNDGSGNVNELCLAPDGVTNCDPGFYLQQDGQCYNAYALINDVRTLVGSICKSGESVARTGVFDTIGEAIAISALPDPSTSRAAIVYDALTADSCEVDGGDGQVVLCLSDGVTWQAKSAGSLQKACGEGEICGWDNLTEALPLTIAPLGDAGPRKKIYGLGGDYFERFVYGPDGSELDMPPEEVWLPNAAGPWCVRAPLGEPPTSTDLGCIENVDGTLGGVTYTGVFAPTTTISSEKCMTLDAVTAADDNMVMGSFDVAVTLTKIWCHYQGSAPSTAAVFTSGTGTHSTLTCAGPTAAATAQTISSGALAAKTPFRFSTTNTPNPTTDTYELCVGYTIP